MVVAPTPLSQEPADPRISVVIPSCSEGLGLLSTLQSLERFEIHEVIVAAVGEAEETRCAALRDPRVTWVECAAPSRGEQLNAGASRATGDILLFLHADTRLPENATRAMVCTLSQAGVVGGAFRLGFDRRHPALDLLVRMTALEWPVTYFGDQGMFCRRIDFEALGGFAAVPILEDVHLAWRLVRRGRLARATIAVTTSSRRLTRVGPWRQLGLNSCLLILYYLGLPTRLLAAAYRPDTKAGERGGPRGLDRPAPAAREDADSGGFGEQEVEPGRGRSLSP